MKAKLFRPIDNAPLILFRIFFGFLFACETFGAIVTGWVRNNFIVPEFTFSHIGMEWLQPLPGYGMYFYFGTMGCLSLLVMLGYKYRYSLGLLTVGKFKNLTQQMINFIFVELWEKSTSVYPSKNVSKSRPF